MSSMLTMNGTCNCVHVYVQYTVLTIIEKIFSTSTSTSTLFNKNIDHNRLACKIAIANLGGTVKRKIK